MLQKAAETGVCVCCGENCSCFDPKQPGSAPFLLFLGGFSGFWHPVGALLHVFSSLLALHPAQAVLKRRWTAR
jgi:hypothetical protein